MQASPLRLEHYSLKAFSFEAVDEATTLTPGTYADFDNANYSSSVTFRQLLEEGLSDKYLVQLILKLEPDEGKDFPYRTSISLVGFFDGSALNEDMRDSLVAANGASILYGAARDLILEMSHKSYKGSVLLPSVSFANVGEDIRLKKLQQSEENKKD